MKVKTYYCRVVEDQEFENHMISEEIYDENEMKIEHADYDEAGNLLLKEYRTYDGDALVEQKTVNYVAKIIITKTFKYQGKLLVEEKELFENGTFQLTIHKYNDQGKLINTYMTDEENAYLGEEKITINGNEKEVEYYDDQHFKFRVEKITHNDEGEILEKITQDIYENVEPSNEEMVKEHIEYDRNNNLKSSIGFRGDAKQWEAKYSYDYKNRLESEELWSVEEEGITVVKHSYDARGNAIVESIFQDGVLVEEIKFAYNSNNQMIRFDNMTLATDDYPYRTRYYYKYEK